MKYLELIPDPETTDPIQLKHFNRDLYQNKITRDAFEALPKMSVAYFDNTPQAESYDVLFSPALFVSDPLKNLLELYEPDMSFRAIQCYPEDKEDLSRMPLYWYPYLEEVECLDERSERYPNGWIKSMRLKEHKIGSRSIFLVGGLLETKWVISLPLAESMLRREMCGFCFAEITLERQQDERRNENERSMGDREDSFGYSI